MGPSLVAADRATIDYFYYLCVCTQLNKRAHTIALKDDVYFLAVNC